MIEIVDINDKQIKEFVSLRKSSHDENMVVVESKNVLKKLFSTNLKIYKIFTTSEQYDFINENCDEINFPIYKASTELMKQIVGHKIHQGMMALIEKPSYIDFDLIKGDIVVLNSLTSPENVGSIVRSCASFGVKNIIVDEECCSPYLRRCIRVSTGNIFNINVYKSSNLKDDLKLLQNSGYSILATANEKEAISLQEYDFTTKTAFIIGNEGFGVEKEIMSQANNILKIDISDDVTSLNASIAASIVLYQISISKKLVKGKTNA